MGKELVLVIDVGTTNCKAVAFDSFGNVVHHESKTTQIICDRLGPGWVEIDISHVWDSICEIARKVSTEAVETANRIACVSLTTLRQSILPIGRNLEPLRYVIPWCVKATSREADWVRRNIGEEEIYRITGLTIDPEWALPSILYIRDREKEVFSRTFKILEVQDYVAYKLGADSFVTDYSQASCLSIFDVVKMQWSDAILNKISLRPEMLPSLVPPGECVGRISSQASESTGIPKGCPIILAGADSQCSALGCGVVAAGKANVVVGTSAVAMAYAEKPLFDPERRLVTHPHCYGGKYIIDHQTLTGGVAYKWYRDEFCRLEVAEARSQGTSVYEQLNRGISGSPLGANGILFLPHFVGAASPYWNEKARGVILGLSLNSKREDIGRALIEGIAMEVERGFEIMRKLGVDLTEVSISGGGCTADSPWSRIQADVYGVPTRILRTSETTALGAAVLGWIALKAWQSIGEASKNMVRTEYVVEPNVENTAHYRSLMELQEQAYRSLERGHVYDQLGLLRERR